MFNYFLRPEVDELPPPPRDTLPLRLPPLDEGTPTRLDELLLRDVFILRDDEFELAGWRLVLSVRPVEKVSRVAGRELVVVEVDDERVLIELLFVSGRLLTEPAG